MVQMRILKRAIKRALRNHGYELCQLYDEEKREVPHHEKFTYKEAQCYRALASMSHISLEEARVLGELVRSSDPTRPIIEIGTLFGFSTIVMTLFKQREQQLITVDNYSWNPLGIGPDAHYQLTRNRLSEAVDEQNVQVLRIDKDEFYRSYIGAAPALFFCDADHSYEATKADILWARSAGASLICGDDYKHPFQHGVTQIVDELGGPRKLVGGLFVI